MTRLAGLVLLSALAVPAAASHPTRARQEKPRPTQSAEPPLAVPVPIPPAPVSPAGRAGQARDEAAELPNAGADFHRFWKNRPAGVLTFER